MQRRDAQLKAAALAKEVRVLQQHTQRLDSGPCGPILQQLSSLSSTAESTEVRTLASLGTGTSGNVEECIHSIKRLQEEAADKNACVAELQRKRADLQRRFDLLSKEHEIVLRRCDEIWASAQSQNSSDRPTADDVSTGQHRNLPGHQQLSFAQLQRQLCQQQAVAEHASKVRVLRPAHLIGLRCVLA